MSALVVDTSSWISYLAGRDSPAIRDALGDGRLHLPPIVAAELLSGTLSARDARELQALLADLPLCQADLAHWIRVGALRASLRRSGLAISTPDAHVAQCALDLQGELLTEDAIFKRVPKLRLAAR